MDGIIIMPAWKSGFSSSLLVLGFLASCTITLALDLSPPTILHPESALTLDPGSELVLTCHGDQALHWRFPNFQIDDRFQYKYSENEDNSVAARPFSTTLIISNVTTKEVGLIECVYNSTEMEDSIYLWVNDTKKHLVVESYHLIKAGAGDTLIIPCKPTNTFVDIAMKRDADDVDLKKGNYKYDPKVGLILTPATQLDFGVYKCVGKRRGSLTESVANWLVTIFAPPPEITLRTPQINATDNGVIGEGSDFTVDCITSEENGVYYYMKWVEPGEVLNSSRARTELIPIPEPNRKAFRSRLTVYNATREDSGLYVCEVGSSIYNSSRTNSKEIRVYGRDHTFLNVTTDAADIREQRGFEAIWIINVTSYPTSVDYIWTDGKTGLELGRESGNSRHRIKKEGNRITLKILNASLKDFGSYRFMVTLKNRIPSVSKTLDLSLKVLDKPKVFAIKDAPTYFQEGENYTLSCHAQGFPVPELKWYFQETQVFNSSWTQEGCRFNSEMKVEAPSDVSTSGFVSKSTITFTPNKHGVLRCTGINDEGISCTQAPVKVIDFPGDRDYGILAPNQFIDQDKNVSLSCTISKLDLDPDNSKSNVVKWKVRKQGETKLEDIVGDNSSLFVRTVETPWSLRRVLDIPKLDGRFNGEYFCLIEEDGKRNESESLNITVLAMSPPKIYSTNLNGSEVVFKEGEHTGELFCQASGVPTPTIVWRKDGLPPSEWGEEVNYAISEDGSTLSFSYIKQEASGHYSCIARNRNGSDVREIEIEVKGAGIHPVITFIIIFFLVVIIILVFTIVFHYHKQQKMKEWLRRLHEAEFQSGDVEKINPELGVQEQANLLPYESKWEFPRSRLHLGMQLGSGAFGRVMKAEAVGIIPEEPVTTVAVKMVKPNAEETHIKALMSELKIMVHLGRHVNVVNLLGAVTTQLVKKKELFVVVEYCKYGSLLNYMHRHRHTFINQLDPVRGFIDSAIYRQTSRTSQQSETVPRLNYASLTFTDTGNSRTGVNGYRTLEEIPAPAPTPPPKEVFLTPTPRRLPSDYDGNFGAESVCTDMSFVSDGYGSKRRSSGASSTWGDGGGHYRGDYQHVDVRPIRSVDLLCWAFQIARGMEYLATRKVLHGDLAARNVLLSENNVVKICDFGLAKEMYKDYKYKKKSEGVLLPVKWMAIESIYYGVFSSQSDVWSFGVVLWELFTLGKTPYPGMEANDAFYKMLSEGYRMEKPPLAPSSIYDVMTECWSHDVGGRPTFTTLVDRIGDLMEEGHRQEYVDLNVPYDRMNREWMAGREDYLSKMSGPDFVTAGEGQTERDYQNVQILEEKNGGYLIPNPPSETLPYQNVQRDEPHGHILANNVGYVFMNQSPAIEEAPHPQPPQVKLSSYVKFDIDRGENETETESNTISNMGYVAVGIQPEDEESSETTPSSRKDIPKSSSLHPNSSSEDMNGKHPRRLLRRHKNDSGLGSIDSNHFDPVPIPQDENDEENADIDNSQHNIGYVSHSFQNHLEIPNGNGVIA